MAVDVTEVEQVEQDPTERVSIMVGMPFEMKELLKAAADKAENEDGSTGQPVAEFVRDLLADHLGYTIPQRTSKRVRRYASEEEKKAAQKARGKERRATIKNLLALYKQDPALKARLEEQMRAAANGEDEEEDDTDS